MEIAKYIWFENFIFRSKGALHITHILYPDIYLFIEHNRLIA